MSNLRDQILAADDLLTVEMSIPEWDDVKIEIRSMSAAERGEMIGRASDGAGGVNYQTLYPLILIASVFDPETGEQVFSSDDIGVLQTKNGAVMERIAEKAMDMAGLKDVGNNVDAAGKDS